MAETAHFGSRQVPLQAKQALVDDVFHSVARRYDLMNDLMSFGLHRAWKNALVTAVNPPKRLPFSAIDIAGGTGDIAFRIIDAGGTQTRDAATIAFGIRNVPRIECALAEAYRVLKIGGRFICLEFSSVDVPALDRIYDFYSFNVIPALGRMVVGDAESYRYLVESIRRFPKPQAFAAMLRAAGFARVSFQAMSGGIVTLHSGWRL